jgi:hypothetical protein
MLPATFSSLAAAAALRDQLVAPTGARQPAHINVMYRIIVGAASGRDNRVLPATISSLAAAAALRDQLVAPTGARQPAHINVMY